MMENMPRWARVALVVALDCDRIGRAASTAYRYFTRPVTLTIAAGLSTAKASG